MLGNYLKIAFRNLWKHKLFSFINVFGLALSLAVCMMVMLRTKEDLSYDNFHPSPDRTYRILSDIVENKDHERYKLASTPLPLKNELSRETSIVEDVVQIYPALNGKAGYGDKELSIHGAFTDPSFFKIFGFRLSAGNEKTALSQTNGIVLSSETAFKFFGKTDPVGKVLHVEKMGVFQVTGVLEKAPGKSHLVFDAYASSLAITQLEKTKVLPAHQDSWNSMQDGYTYVLLKANVSSENLNSLLKQVSLKPELKSGDGEINFIGQPLSEITPGKEGIYNEIGPGTVWAKLLTVVGVGFIILLAAGFNYTNLTIARALTRSKEVGIRKVSGAKRGQIFLQYIVEAILIALLGLVFACLGLALFKPAFHIDFYLLIWVILFTILTGAIAGFFPAWILSAFKPVNVLKSIATQKLFGNLSLRKGLMIFQFSISLLIIIFLSAYYRQFSYLETIDPGFSSKNILTIPFSGKNEVFPAELSRLSGIAKMFRSSENFGIRGDGAIPVFLNKPVTGQGILISFYFTDAAAIPVHQLKLVAGSNFPENEEFDKEKYILINQKASEVFGFENSASAIGNTVWLNDSTQVEIKGVVKDFYDKGAARYITPLMLRNRSDAFNYLNIQIDGGDNEKVVKQISSLWNKLNPHTPFAYEWLDKKIAQREDQSGAYSILGLLAFITISIASLGLFGLVIYTVETRKKEIGIRKVMGASINRLMFLLSKGFLKILLIAGVIAMPTGYIVSLLFLQNFANRVPLGLGTLLLCFLLLLVIELITILSSTRKASGANPVKTLRSE